MNARRRRLAKRRRRQRREERLYMAALANLYDTSLMYEGFEDYETDDDYGLFFITFGEPAP